MSFSHMHNTVHAQDCNYMHSHMSTQYLTYLLETLHECWDDDAEARLSAANVSLRLQELIHTNISDITRQDSIDMTTVSSSVPSENISMFDIHRSTEYSQSSPPSCYSLTDSTPVQQFHFYSNPNPRHQISVPLDDEQEYLRMGNGHASTHCTQILCSSLHYEQEMVQMDNFNGSESLIIRNPHILSRGGAVQEMSDVDEVNREQSPLGHPLVESQNESEGFLEQVTATVCEGLENGGSLDREELSYQLPSVQCSDFEYDTESNKLTLKVLTEELETVTDPIRLGIGLGVPQHRLEIMQKNNPQGLHQILHTACRKDLNHKSLEHKCLAV